MRILRAATAEDLASMSSELHDSWIELPELGSFESPQALRLDGRLELGEVRPLRTWGPLVRALEVKPRLELTVEGVTAVVLEDFADIGGLNLSSLTFDEIANTVTIEGHVPVSLTLVVESLGVEVTITDEIVERRERWRLRSHMPTGSSDR